MVGGQSCPADGLEEIFDPAQPIIDSHIHLSDRWNYGVSALLADLGTGHNIAATVHIESRTEDYRQDGPAHLRALESVSKLTLSVPVGGS